MRLFRQSHGNHEEAETACGQVPPVDAGVCKSANGTIGLLAVVGIFVEIPFVSMYAFWVAVLAYVVLALGNFLAID
jgi:hypothetical protein